MSRIASNTLPIHSFVEVRWYNCQEKTPFCESTELKKLWINGDPEKPSEDSRRPYRSAGSLYSLAVAFAEAVNVQLAMPKSHTVKSNL
jgi:hypothetical protein